jgi:4-aminobutyrate aminotransferase-like enzyme
LSIITSPCNRRRSSRRSSRPAGPPRRAVANATLDVLEGDALQDNARRVGAHVKASLDALLERHDLVGHIHGRGLFYGVELVADRATKAPAKLAARWVRERMKSLGVLVASSGPLGNIIKIRPPLCIDSQEADACIAALDRSLGEVPVDRRSAHEPKESA